MKMPTNTAFVRLAQLADMPQLMALQERAAQAMSTGRYSPQQIRYFLQHCGTVDVRMLADGEFYVVEFGDRIVGCGGWWPSARRLASDHFAEPAGNPGIVGGPSAVMRAIYVAPGHRHQGIARRLVKTIRRAARVRGLGRIAVVAPDQTEGFFAELGFCTVERFDLTLPGGLGFPLVEMVSLAGRAAGRAVPAEPPMATSLPITA